MVAMTQPQIILKLLESQPNVWFKSYNLRGRDTPWGFCGHQADRRARQLAEEGKVEVRHSKYAEYKWKASGLQTSLGF